jgi:hypothetical protein
MPYFPQLTTGSASQFPCTKRVLQRTVVNEQVDGSTVKLFDPGACRVEWEMDLAGLASAEWEAIRSLFQGAEGRLGTFVFLDPFGNLLKWSEDLSAAAWVKDSGLALTGSIVDPFGGTQATRVQNSAGAEGSLRQTVDVPASYRYCLSVYARSDTPGTVALVLRAGSETVRDSLAVGPAWRRIEMTAQLGSQEEAATFGVAIAAGYTIELFGLQAEPQVGASRYKKTAARNGVYANASFLDDVLGMSSDLPGAFSCPVRIGASASGN